MQTQTELIADHDNARNLAQLVYEAMRAQEYNVRSCKVVYNLILENWDAANQPTALLERFIAEKVAPFTGSVD